MHGTQFSEILLNQKGEKLPTTTDLKTFFMLK